MTHLMKLKAGNSKRKRRSSSAIAELIRIQVITVKIVMTASQTIIVTKSALTDARRFSVTGAKSMALF
jgi:hypothetical protein